jgi:hypothetical protein
VSVHTAAPPIGLMQHPWPIEPQVIPVTAQPPFMQV